MESKKRKSKLASRVSLFQPGIPQYELDPLLYLPLTEASAISTLSKSDAERVNHLRKAFASNKIRYDTKLEDKICEGLTSVGLGCYRKAYNIKWGNEGVRFGCRNYCLNEWFIEYIQALDNRNEIYSVYQLSLDKKSSIAIGEFQTIQVEIWVQTNPWINSRYTKISKQEVSLLSNVSSPISIRIELVGHGLPLDKKSAPFDLFKSPVYYEMYNKRGYSIGRWSRERDSFFGSIITNKFVQQFDFGPQELPRSSWTEIAEILPQDSQQSFANVSTKY